MLIFQRDLVDVPCHLLFCPSPSSVVAHLSVLLHVSILMVLVLALNADVSVGCFGLGFILDLKGFTQRRRAQLGFWTVILLNLGVYIWSIVMQAQFNNSNPGKIDWIDSKYAAAFLPYFFVQTTGPLSQSYGFWLLSSFAEDAQGRFFWFRYGVAFADYQITSETARCCGASRQSGRLSLTE